MFCLLFFFFFFFQAEDGIRDFCLSRGLGDVYKRQDYRKQLSYCGAHSGRDGDKLAACGFSALHLDGAPVLAQSQTALTCRKLFCQQLDPAGFIDTSLDAANYPQKDYHFLYVSEILGAYLF